MKISEGSFVTFIGEGSRRHNGGLALGDQGRVLASGESGCHVLWSTGSRSDQITLTANEDISPRTPVFDDLADSLDDGDLVANASFDPGASWSDWGAV